jgi:hypothetical protein
MSHNICITGVLKELLDILLGVFVCQAGNIPCDATPLANQNDIFSFDGLVLVNVELDLHAFALDECKDALILVVRQIMTVLVLPDIAAETGGHAIAYRGSRLSQVVFYDLKGPPQYAHL